MELRVSSWEIFVKERPEVVQAYRELMKKINKNHYIDLDRGDRKE